jgi:hypothetical protein
MVDLTDAVRAAFGSSRRLTATDRLTGGTNKGVYRLTLDDATTAIAYVWTDEESYWPATPFDDNDRDPFSPASELRLFLAAHARLESLGLRVPALHHVEPDHLAVVEDVPGPDLETRLADDPASAAPAVARLADRLDELHAAGRPRTEFSVVHGELGLDHVLVDASGRPVLIDIENLMYFDAEWEHVFLRIRLENDYHHLAAPGLDEARLALYLLTERLSLVAGPLRLLDGPFPDREFMQGIAEYNLTRALALI